MNGVKAEKVNLKRCFKGITYNGFGLVAVQTELNFETLT